MGQTTSSQSKYVQLQSNKTHVKRSFVKTLKINWNLSNKRDNLKKKQRIILIPPPCESFRISTDFEPEPPQIFGKGNKTLIEKCFVDFIRNTHLGNLIPDQIIYLLISYC